MTSVKRKRQLWVFDLDNTLHNASAHIFPHINRAMMAYIQRALGLNADDATRLRQDYWQRYGATLQGLIRHHGVDAKDFLAQTHDFQDLSSMLDFEGRLSCSLSRLPGRKVVFSNGPESYARAVLGAMRLLPAFDAVYGIEQVAFRPKPDRRSFREVLRREGVPAHNAIMVEDSLANLHAAKRLGMATVLVSKASGRPRSADIVVRSVRDIGRHLPRL